MPLIAGPVCAGENDGKNNAQPPGESLTSKRATEQNAEGRVLDAMKEFVRDACGELGQRHGQR
jgi:hypothetical protein